MTRHREVFPVFALAVFAAPNVGITDFRTQEQQKMSAQPTEICDGVSLGSGRDAEEANDGLTFAIVEAFPKADEGKYVAIFDKLTHEWAARRNNST